MEITFATTDFSRVSHQGHEGSQDGVESGIVRVDFYKEGSGKRIEKANLCEPIRACIPDTIEAKSHPVPRAYDCVCIQLYLSNIVGLINFMLQWIKAL